MSEQLHWEGIKAERKVFSQPENTRRALLLYQLIRDDRLMLPQDDELLEELGNVRLVEVSPNVLKIDHDPSRHDDRVIAISLAVQFLMDRAVRPVTFASARGLRIPGVGDRSCRAS